MASTGTISSSGIGSGLPVESLVTQLMAVEKQPLTVLDKKEASYQSKLSSWGTLKSSLAALQTAAKALSTPAQLSPLKSSTSTAGIVSATAGTGAIPGDYNIEVVSLADAQKLKTSVGYGAVTDVVGSGDISIDFGSYDTSTPPVFSANAAKTAKTISIGSGNNTLAGIRDAINAAGAGVSASIINDGKSNYLSLTSTESGASNAMRISVSDPSLNALSYNDKSGLASEMEQTVAAKDAVIKVDTVTITKPSNTITDAIQGVSLNLSATTATGVTTKLSLARDTAPVQSAIEGFVKAYNDTTKAVADATAYDAATGKAGSLNGDSTVRSIQTQLRALLSKAIPGAPSGSSTLSSIGITTQRDGTLGIDSTKLSSALKDNSKNLSALFATSGTNRGYGAQMDVILGRILSPVGQLPQHTSAISSSISSLDKQRDAINLRLDAIEKRYRAQFSALDTAMASMSKTSAFMTQQLSILSSSTTSY